MFFTAIMKQQRIFIYISLIVLAGLAWKFSSNTNKKAIFSERIKISLRDVGNKLLLVNHDSTSLILPIKEVEKAKYAILFEEELFLEPNQLVTIIDEAFKKSDFPSYYRVEVLQCEDREVAYSYEISAQEEHTIIPCAGRILPESCYIIEVKFTKQVPASFSMKSFWLYMLLILLLIALIDFIRSKKKTVELTEDKPKDYETIGSFYFYPDQNKLVKHPTEIRLSKKECELLSIFVAHPNEIIKRDELTKKVWEDNGVFVGRSLDTYISKLRKKLKEDENIKLTNIHGVGYKLEVRC